MPSKQPAILVRMTKTDKQKVEQIAKREGRSASAQALQFIRRAIREDAAVNG